MNAWSHLPNAHHIDWVLNSLRTDPEKWAAALNAIRAADWHSIWKAAWDATRAAAWDAARATTLNAAWDAARDATRIAAWEAAWDATRIAAWDATRAAAWEAAWDATRAAAHDVILALIVYDDCDQYLQMSYDQLLAWALLSERPQAVLLLPMKWVQEHETLVTSR